MLLDFDGSLSAIVAHPELAAATAGVSQVLAELVRAYAVVALISGRRSDDLRRLVDVEGIRYEGLYGLPAAPDREEPDVERAIADVPNAWAEAKGGDAVSVHYRQSPDPAEARRMLLEKLAPIAEASGRRVIEGKQTVELVPSGVPLKGGVVRRLIVELRLRAALYAGDDAADLEAFTELERARADEGVQIARVAVLGAETPSDLIAHADETVEGPEGLVELLRELVPPS
ncbi:MAG: trehalose-phosphatase [Actinomycetota bacterium]